MFVADRMLGKLARWLRLLGRKVIYARDLSEDDDLVKIACKSNAVLVTRDETLAARAKDYCRVVLLKENDSFKQLQQIAKQFNIKLEVTRTSCPVCSSPVKRIPKKDAAGLVFPRVYRAHRVFWRCTNSACRQVYWRGSHWKDIKNKLSSLKKKN
ncbi:MAG: Mut7-C RNAse domain-containing protein [Candidatus Micrarchaeota archaeon]